MIEWQPVETAPRNEVRILVTDGEEFATAEFLNDRWVVSPIAWDGDGDRGCLLSLQFTPTHWMLPEPPQR